LGATWSFTTTFVAGNVLTAAQLNTLQSDVTTNFTPAGLDDESSNTTAMQATADPGEVGTESLATSLQGEIQRLRNIVKEITGEAQWYVTPSLDLQHHSASGWPSFHVNTPAGGQAGLVGATKVQFDTEEFDTNSDFDAVVNYRFTPTVAGKYLLTSTVAINSAPADQDLLRIYLYKNGASTEWRDVQASGTSIGQSSNITVIVDANGTTDYFEVFFESTGNEDVAATSWFSGSRIA
jgi:hypothetical protein